MPSRNAKTQGAFAGDRKRGKAQKYIDREGLYASPFIKKLQLYLELRGLSQKELADAAKYTKQMISHILKGRTSPPYDERLDRMMDALRLEGQDREELRTEAMLASCPEPIRKLVERLKKENSYLRSRSDSPTTR